jgi:hypothetical protein
MAINHSSELPPWQDPPLPFFTRVIGFFGIICMGGLIVWSIFLLTLAVAQGNFSSEAQPGAGFILLNCVAPLAGIVVGISGWWVIRRHVFKPLNFNPPHLVPAGALSIPFAIYMGKPVDGWGVLLFAPDGLKLKAKASRYEAVNVFDIVRSIVFLLARFVVKNMLRTYQANYTIPYSQVTDVKVFRRRVMLHSPDEKIKKTMFWVSSADGERLYRELNAHFPSAIEEWRHLLAYRK